METSSTYLHQKWLKKELPLRRIGYATDAIRGIERQRQLSRIDVTSRESSGTLIQQLLVRENS